MNWHFIIIVIIIIRGMTLLIGVKHTSRRMRTLHKQAVPSSCQDSAKQNSGVIGDWMPSTEKTEGAAALPRQDRAIVQVTKAGIAR